METRSVDSPQSSAPIGSRIAFAMGAVLILLYFLACTAGPFVLLSVAGPVWAVSAGVILPLSWMFAMPTTCVGGGLLWSMIAMNMLLLLGGWTVFGVSLLVRAIA